MLFLIMAVVYVLLGAIVARKRYAALYVPPTPGIEAAPADKARTKDALEREINSLKRTEIEHTFACPSNGWHGESYRIKYCRCDGYGSRDRRISQINKALMSGDYALETPATPGYEPSVVLNVAMWPYFLVADFVTAPSNAVQKQRATELATARHEAALAEIRLREAEALDRELALVQRGESVLD